MKILQLGKFHPIKGGVEKVMLDLTKGLADNGHRCDMLCAAVKGAYSLPIAPTASILAVRTLFKLKATMISPAMIVRLRRIARNYDIIHIHHPDPMAALALYLSGFKGKVVLHWHSDILRQRQLLRLFKPLQSWLLKRADHIVTTSPSYRDESPWLADHLDKCTFVPIGIRPVKDTDPALVEDLRKRLGHRRIVFAMGRLVGYKGFEYLIEAARWLPDDYVIVIGGNGPLRDQLQKQIVDASLHNKVILYGFIPDDELPLFYRAASLFCLPSIERTEAFGVVQIEAMSCSTPIVACRIPGSGVAWVNADGVSGLNVQPRDPQALADAIRRVAEVDNETFRQGSLDRFYGNFTEKHMIEKIEKLYKNFYNVK